MAYGRNDNLERKHVETKVRPGRHHAKVAEQRAGCAAGVDRRLGEVHKHVRYVVEEQDRNANAVLPAEVHEKRMRRSVTM